MLIWELEEISFECKDSLIYQYIGKVIEESNYYQGIFVLTSAYKIVPNISLLPH